MGWATPVILSSTMACKARRSSSLVKAFFTSWSLHFDPTPESREHYPKAADLTEEARQTGGDLLLNANPAALSEVVGSNEKSTGEITAGQATSVDHGFTVISPQENSSPRMETTASSQTPADALTPEVNHPDVQANASSSSPAHWQDPAREIRPKIHVLRSRSSVRPRFVDVKMRLIALWHQSLVR